MTIHSDSANATKFAVFAAAARTPTTLLCLIVHPDNCGDAVFRGKRVILAKGESEPLFCLRVENDLRTRFDREVPVSRIETIVSVKTVVDCSGDNVAVYHIARPLDHGFAARIEDMFIEFGVA